MKLRFFSGGKAAPTLTIAILTGVIALLILGGKAYGWVAEHRSLHLLDRQITQPPATAIFVPKRAPVAISLLASIDDLTNLQRLVTPNAKRRSSEDVIKLWKRWVADRLHLDYQREIAPWLGEEITLAITDLNFDRIAENPPPSGYLSFLTNRQSKHISQPGYLAVLTTNNAKLSASKIQAWWKRQVAAKKMDFQTYQGVKIGYNERDRVASAIVANKYILFANHPKVLRAAINNLQVTNLSILDNPTYQNLLAANNHHRIGIGYAGLTELAPWLGTEAGAKYPQAGFNLGIDRQGLIADIVFYPTADRTADRPQIPPEKSSTSPGDTTGTAIAALTYLPPQSTIAIAGVDLQNWQQQLTNILPPQPQLIPLLDRQLNTISQQLGIDLTKDIFSWTTGEYAIAAIPNPTHKTPDWVFVAERTQPELVDGAIADFDELARLAGYNVGLLPWKERQVIGWTKLTTQTTPNSITQLVAQVPLTHTTLDRYTIFASSVEAMDNTLKSIDTKSILDSDRYRRATNLIAADRSGYLYANWDTLASILPDRGGKIGSIGEAILTGLPNISFNSYTTADTQRITLLLQPR